MWTTRISNKAVKIFIWTEFLLLIVIPNLLVRSSQPGPIRPLFYSLLSLTVGLGIVVGLVSEYYNLRFNDRYSSKRNRLRFYLVGPIAAAVVPFLFWNFYQVTSDLTAHSVFATPYRVISATISDRTGFPGAFIFADEITLDNSLKVTLPYSDLPRVGGRYIFTLLPTKNIVLYYEAISGPK